MHLIKLINVIIANNTFIHFIFKQSENQPLVYSLYTHNILLHNYIISKSMYNDVLEIDLQLPFIILADKFNYLII